MSDDAKRVLQQANAAIAQGDFDGFLRFCTDDTKWTFVGDRTISGKAAVREWMKATYKTPPRFEVERMVAEGDTVIALGEITLTDDQGNTAPHAYCDVWRLRGGQLAELRAFVVAASGPALKAPG
jgi:uncharacterized protein